MRQTTQINELAAALVKAQDELRAIAKDSTNPHFKNRYTSLDAIVESVRPVLARHGLAVVQGTTTPESDAASKVTAFTVETTILHTSGQWLSSAVIIPLAKADPQGAGGALTYGRRYGLSAALCLSTEEDDDGNQASKPAKQGKGGAQSRAAGVTSGEMPPATTQPLALNRDSLVPFAPAHSNGARPTVGELPYKFLNFVLEQPSKRIPGSDRDRTAWIACFTTELDGRQAGDFTMREKV